MATNITDITSSRCSGTRVASGKHLAPVVILNMFYSGLGIARDLSGRGLRVIGLSADRNAYGNSSRFCEIRRAPSSQHDPHGLADFLLRAGNDLRGAVIFPTRDSDVMFLDHYRSDLQDLYTLPIPSSHCLRRTTNKYELTAAASAAGVAVPRTVQLDSFAELTQVANKIGFPCVLKPITSVEWHEADAWERVGCRKAVRVSDWQSLRIEYETISKVTPRVLVQEWVSGPVDQIVVLGGYITRSSELAAYFTARKILQSPDDCGTGCIVQAEAIDAIVEPSRRLLHELQYEGMAEIEYKYDSQSGEYKLIEINTRHWDQHQLGNAFGVNLSWVAYCDVTGSDGSSKPLNPKRRVVWVAEDALLVRMMRSIAHPELRVRDLSTKLSGQRVYAITAARDPLPFCRFLFGGLLPIMFNGLADKCRKLLRSHL